MSHQPPQKQSSKSSISYSPHESDDPSYLDSISRDEINQALQELENLKMDMNSDEGASGSPVSVQSSLGANSTFPTSEFSTNAFSGGTNHVLGKNSMKRKKPGSAAGSSSGRKSAQKDPLRATLENRLLMNDQIAKKIHAKSKNLELENQRLRERIEQMDAAISNKVKMSGLLRRLDEQEVIIQELTSYCEALESKCEHIEQMYGSKDHHDKTKIQLKTQQQRIQLLEGKYESVQNAYQELLNVKVDRFIQNWSASKGGKKVEKKNDPSQELIVALRNRLNALMQERTIEHNMHNSALFELEAQVAKWYSDAKSLRHQLNHVRSKKSSGENPLDYVT